jgi:hypothetical protein
VEIFEGMEPGGADHCATLALLAEGQMKIGRYSKAIGTLEKLQRLQLTSHPEVFLARVKAMWYSGDFVEDLPSVCQNLVELANNDKCSVLTRAAAFNSDALINLLGDYDESRDLNQAASVFPLQCATDLLEKTHPLACAAVYNNLGIVQAVYAIENDMHYSLDTWSKGRLLVEKISTDGVSAIAAKRIQAKILANLAWAMLQVQESDVDNNDKGLKSASESA